MQKERQKGLQKIAIWAFKMFWRCLIRQRRVCEEKERGAVWSAEAPRQPHARGLLNDKNNNEQQWIERTLQLTLSNTL